MMSSGKHLKQGGGSIYFQNSKNTEISELQDNLNSMKIDLQKDAMKQIIAAMTVGKDVSPLFPHVIKCMRTTSIELKKLIYLYIINYAGAKPDQAILAVNAFHQDATDKTSPLIRALAVRTMGCIRIEMIVTYLCETLKLVLKDEDAYVRKTACVCVAKLYNTCPVMVKDNGFIDMLDSMLGDGNSIVVSNALVALTEISLLSGENCIKIKSKNLKRILSALAEANEWGQVYILDSLMKYSPLKKQSEKAERIIEAVIPRLSHANPAVALCAVKVILKFLDWVENEESVGTFSKKLSTSMMTIMTSRAEIQYILLRGMHAIIQKRPHLLENDYRYFFIQYNDPIYVKLEKLEILYKVADKKNFSYIMNEFKSYACLEFDNDLVHRAIKYLGIIGFRFENACNLCVDNLIKILDYNQDFTVNQAIIMIRDLMRKYKVPKTKEFLNKINKDLIKLVTLPESKAALLYIIGENCSSISDSTEYISSFVENFGEFGEENEKVKLQILNAVIKNFVNKPDETEELVKHILQKGAEEAENPDIRDRAYLYWRLLEVDPDAAKEMIMAEKPGFVLKEEKLMEQTLVDDIINNLTNISAVYHKESNLLLLKEDMISDEHNDNEETSSSPELQNNKSNKENKKSKQTKIIESKVNKQDADLLGLGEDFFDSFNNFNSNQTTSAKNLNSTSPVFDIFSGSDKISNSINYDNDIEFIDNESSRNLVTIFDENSGVSIPKPTLIYKYTDRGQGQTCGLQVYAQFHRENQKILLGFNIANNMQVQMNNFKIVINSNSFGVSIEPKNNLHLSELRINSETNKNIILNVDVIAENINKKIPESPYSVDVCIRNNVDDFYLSVPLLVNVLLVENGKMSNSSFIPFLKNNSQNKVNYKIECDKFELNESNLKKIFERNNIFEVAKNNKMDPPLIYYTANISSMIPIIIEVSLSKSIYLF